MTSWRVWFVRVVTRSYVRHDSCIQDLLPDRSALLSCSVCVCVCVLCSVCVYVCHDMTHLCCVCVVCVCMCVLCSVCVCVCYVLCVCMYHVTWLILWNMTRSHVWFVRDVTRSYVRHDSCTQDLLPDRSALLSWCSVRVYLWIRHVAKELKKLKLQSHMISVARSLCAAVKWLIRMRHDEFLCVIGMWRELFIRDMTHSMKHDSFICVIRTWRDSSIRETWLIYTGSVARSLCAAAVMLCSCVFMNESSRKRIKINKKTETSEPYDFRCQIALCCC